MPSINLIYEIIYSNLLFVRVSPAAAVEFQHYKDKIIEKINSFFGYKAIVEIRLQQNFLPKNNHISNSHQKNKVLNNTEKKIIKNDIKKIKDKNLEKSLEKLGQSINEYDN